MPAQKWEFCRLYVSNEQEHTGEGRSFEIGVYYLGAETRFYKLAELGKQIFQSNPFPKAMGLLGVAGWELVSVQHGLLTTRWNEAGAAVEQANWFSEIVAYFKRPVKPGRAVDEPRIVL